jgi:carboxymethylenebutenolidase
MKLVFKAALSVLWLGAALPAGAQIPVQMQAAQGWATQKLAASPRRREWVTLDAGGQALRACVIYPQDRPKAPVVLVLHEVFGLTDSTLNTADEIAAMGYVVIAPDMLSGLAPNGGGTPGFPSSREAANVNTAVPPEAVDARVAAWAAYGLALPQAEDRLAIVGLSWGGGEAFRYAADPGHNPALKLIAVFYDVGPPAVTQGPNRDAKTTPPASVAAIDVPVYGFYGGTDARVINSLPATKAAMAAAGKVYQPTVYDGADHAFMRLGEDPANTNPADAAAAKASLARLKGLLDGL